MNMTLYWTGYICMAASLMLALYVNYRYRKIVYDLLGKIIDLNGEIMKQDLRESERDVIVTYRALVEERPCIPMPCFAVYREGALGKYDVARLQYNPSDPADRVVKARQADRIAEALNEEL